MTGPSLDLALSIPISAQRESDNPRLTDRERESAVPTPHLCRRSVASYAGRELESASWSVVSPQICLQPQYAARLRTMGFRAYESPRISPTEMQARAEAFYRQMNARRTVRDFSDQHVPRVCIEHAIATASTAPSGAHRQPWTFVAVSDPAVKQRVQQAAEEEERINYGGRMPPAFREALEPLGTQWEKPFLSRAPWLIVVFEHVTTVRDAGERAKNYYVKESVGMACGFLLAALHNMGLSALTHTPSPMGFLRDVLQRPSHERPYVLVVTGYPEAGCRVPDLTRKPLHDVSVWVEPEASG